MKRVALALLLVLAAAAAIGSRYAAGVARDTHEALVDALVATPGVRVYDEHFSAGWFASSADLELEVTGALAARVHDALVAGGREDARPRLGFRVRQALRHGPAVLWETIATQAPAWLAVSSQIAVDRELQAELRPLTGRVPELWVETRVGLGGARGDVAWPGLAFRAKLADGSVAEGHLEGVEGVFTLDAGATRLAGSVGGAGGSLALPGLRFELGDFEVSFDFAHGEGGWRLASATSRASRLSWDRSGEPGVEPAPVLSLGGLRAEYEVAPGDALAFELRAESEGGTLLGAALTEASAKLVASGFDADGRAPLTRLLSRPASLEPIELSLATEFGVIRLQGGARFTPSPGTLLDPLGGLHGELRARVPTALAQRAGPEAEALAQRLRERGWLHEETGDLVVALGVERGVATARAPQATESAAVEPAAGLSVLGDAPVPVPAAPPPAPPAARAE
jgi:hypothetical protein